MDLVLVRVRVNIMVRVRLVPEENKDLRYIALQLQVYFKETVFHAHGSLAAYVTRSPQRVTRPLRQIKEEKKA